MVLGLAAARPAHAQEGGRYDHYEVYDTDFFPRSEYAGRRQRALAQLDAGSALLVRAADERVRSNDVEYPYRQRNNFLYLTGVTEARSALLLSSRPIAIGGRQVHEILFVSPRDPSRETWNGIMMGPEAASKVTGIPTVLAYEEMRGILDTLLPSLSTLYYDDWLHEAEVEPLTGTSFPWEVEMRGHLAGSLDVKSAGAILNRMRVIKSAAEIEMMRRAIDITVKGHQETMRGARPGMHEYELQSLMEGTFQRLGAESPGYPSIVGSGPNSCILHYETNRRQTAPGDLVLMDCGAEYHGYSADVTRTIPISGRFSAEQRSIYELVLQAQTAAIDLCRPGNDFRDPHRKAAALLAEGLMRLGIIQRPGEVIGYFMHGTSHYLGMDVHDVGIPGKLVAGMVMTVEPGIYIPAGSKCDPKWWNIGVRIEDDILVSPDGPVNLSGALARSPDDVERLMQHSP